jgi:hypothetical protein
MTFLTSKKARVIQLKFFISGIKSREEHTLGYTLGALDDVSRRIRFIYSLPEELNTKSDSQMHYRSFR